MRVLLIGNAHARRGLEPLDPALDVFARAGFSVTHESVEKAREAPALIRRLGEHADAIVLAGGDGTVHEAAPVLLQLGRPVGILPRGTANDLARAISLPLDLQAAAEVIAQGATRRIDVGEVNGRLFFNVAHIGIGAALESGLTAGMKRRLGPLAYTVAAVLSLARMRPFRAEIHANGDRIAIRGFGISVGNGRYFGGSGLIAEDAQIDDGLLHLFTLSTKNPLRLLLLAPDLVKGRQGRSKWVQTVTASALEVRTTRPMRVRADGKMAAETPAIFTVRPAALTVFAPRNRGENASEADDRIP